MAFQRVANFSDLREGGVVGVDVEGTPVALYRLGAEIFATHGVCTHAMALLAEGWVEDGTIECPLHQGRFDIRTGKALCEPLTRDVETYAALLDNDDVLVDLHRSADHGCSAESEGEIECQSQGGERQGTTSEVLDMNMQLPVAITKRYVWPAEGLTRIPDWVYTDQWIYEREVEKIFHGKTWNFVALECEIPDPGDFIRSNVGPTSVIVSRAQDRSINVFENRCAHRAAEFCRTLSGNVKEFVCPYHQWTYDLTGKLAGVPFRRGVNGKGGMPTDFKTSEHGPRRLKVAAHRGVVFASYAEDVEPLAQYFGADILKEFEATFDGRRLKLLGYYRHTLPGNWKLYHENLRDPYHATLLHTFLVTFGLVVAGNKSIMFMDPSGRHGVMGSAKSDAREVSNAAKKEMRSFKEGMTLAEPRFMNFYPEFDSPWSVTMSTIWPNLIVQREMNTLGIRHIVPTGPHEFIMKWTMFGFEGDDEEMTRHRLRQGNLMGPAGFLGLEDNEAIKFVQDGMQRVPNGEHLVKLGPQEVDGTTDSLISETAIRAMYQYWRNEMGL
jgi:apoptosis-inducing factor 3